MKKIFALLPAFCFMLLACNDTSDTESTTYNSTSSSTATETNTNTTNNVVTDEKSSDSLKKLLTREWQKYN
jgi:hypothetical protein